MNASRICLYILLLISIPFCFLQAEDANLLFHHYQVENGLSNNMVTACVQDKDGYIWIGTRDGLNRFDGYNFKGFRQDSDSHSLGSNWISCLACDSTGNLWVGTLSGLYEYIPENESFKHIPFTTNKSITDFKFDKQNNLWLLLDGNLIKYNKATSEFKTFTHHGGQAYTSFCITDNNQIWIGDMQGDISLFDTEQESVKVFNLFDKTPGISPQKIRNVYPSAYSNKLYIAYEHDDIKVLDTQTGVYEDLDIQKVSQLTFLISCLLEKSPDELWIGTDSGLLIYRIDKKSCKRIQPNLQDSQSLSGHYISALYKDERNGIWVGTQQHGINFYSPFQPFKVHYPGDSNNTMVGESVRDICCDTNGNIWIGTEDAGINCFNRETGSFTNYRPIPGGKGLSHTNIRGLAIQDEQLWIGHVIHGIDRMDIKTRKIIKHYPLLKDSTTTKNSTVYCIKVMRNGQIYVGSSDGIYRYNLAKDKFVHLQQFPSYSVRCIYEDEQGRIWTGMFNRSYYFNPYTNTGMYLPYDKLNTQRHNFVNDICQDISGNMWFATHEGVIRYDFQTGESIHYTVKNGMPSNVAYRILPDKQGKLWISTANGLVCMNRKAEITTFTEGQGLLSRQFNENSALSAPDSLFYFGSVKGFIYFNPTRILPKEEKLDVHLNELYIDYDQNKGIILNMSSTSPHKKVTLNHRESTFSINFSALNFSAPNSIQYAYRIGNADMEWTPTYERNTVYFTDMQPGKYLFEVKAANLSHQWSNDITQLEIEILPPWWESIYARLTYTLGIILILFFYLYKWREKTKRTLSYNMRLFEDQKEKELYQAKIDFFINIAHEIRTPLTLIKSPLEKLLLSTDMNDSEKKSLSLMDKNVSRLLALVNQLLDFRKTEVEGYKLNFVRTDIISLLKDQLRCFQELAEEKGKNIHFTSENESIPIFIDREAITKIFTNLLSNAIKYANKEIHIEVVEEGNNLKFIFSNDGKPVPDDMKEKIFEPFYRVSDLENPKLGTGLGLPLARSLAEMHQGSLQLLKEDKQYTTFCLVLPKHLPERVSTEEERAENTEKASYTYNKERASILIVEDNADLLEFIAEEINLYYNIFTAKNGKEALCILDNTNVHLIISDIMMPEMDGLELLKQIRSMDKYSHIPIILLTAKTTVQSHMEGLKLGADAYIEKPFSTSLLIAQISNLLSNRTNISKFYSSHPAVEIEFASSPKDNEFLEKLNQVIIDHLGDQTLDVSKVAELLGITRQSLYRKTKNICDQTPNELINKSRLKKAAELLIKGDMRIYEISEACGFKNQSYFWVAFTKRFGCSPSQYAKERRIDENKET